MYMHVRKGGGGVYFVSGALGEWPAYSREGRGRASGGHAHAQVL